MQGKMNVLIAGSRDMSPEMAKIVQTVVSKQWWQQNRIIVGDARGVDAGVVKWCEKLGVDYLCYTPHIKPRNGALVYKSVIDELELMNMPKPAWYSARDKLMVRDADKVICISRPELTSGTEAVFNYAKFRHKPVVMRTVLKTRLPQIQATRIMEWW